MDTTDRDQTVKRPESTPEPAFHSSLPPGGTIDTDIVSICGWCSELRILKLARRSEDLITINIHGNELMIYRNGQRLFISHGLCAECRRREFPETVKP